MMAFCVLAAAPALEKARGSLFLDLKARLACGTFLAVLLLMTHLPHLTWENGLIVSKSRWDKDYVSLRLWPLPEGCLGTVVCPEDPTIPFYGNGYVGPSFYAEKDARGVGGQWPREMPEPILAELRNADFVVDLRECWGEGWGESVDDTMLKSLGFQTIDVSSIDPGYYRIWRKTNHPVAVMSPMFSDRVLQSDQDKRSIR